MPYQVEAIVYLVSLAAIAIALAVIANNQIPPSK